LIDRNATVIRVPWDYDFTNEEYDGVFISNGPGDPAMCDKTVEHVHSAIKAEKPIMGICLGNQLLARAAGADTYKLKYGHRSHNQPVLLKDTNKCYITSQNHGYAVKTETLPSDWEPLFTNVNDNTNEGIKHKILPFFSTQFHPEASSGPTDTEFLFDDFMKNVEDSKK
jgi:carbamoyl-phosphate synthase small subunit